MKSLRSGSSFIVSTPAGAAGIRGTTFRVVFRPQGNGTAFFTITTIEGDVGVTTTDGTVTTPISVTDQQEIEILVEVDDVTGEVTVLSAPADLQVKTASTEVIATVTKEVQEAAEAVVEIVLKAESEGSGTIKIMMVRMAKVMMGTSRAGKRAAIPALNKIRPRKTRILRTIIRLLLVGDLAGLAWLLS